MPPKRKEKRRRRKFQEERLRKWGGGNVFQLAKEARKGNQFTQTLEALKDYVAIELDHAKDLAPFLETPS